MKLVLSNVIFVSFMLTFSVIVELFTKFWFGIFRTQCFSVTHTTVTTIMLVTKQAPAIIKVILVGPLIPDVSIIDFGLVKLRGVAFGVVLFLFPKCDIFRACA